MREPRRLSGHNSIFFSQIFHKLVKPQIHATAQGVDSTRWLGFFH